MRPTVIVFAKAPVPGRVKTRLGLDGTAAAWLHDRFVRETIALCLRLDANVELHTDIATAAWNDLGLSAALQSSGDLGERMLAALARHPHGMVVGSDAPTLPLTHLARLLRSGADIALGPAEDGGYYAIACRRTAPDMFRGVEWSSGSELLQTAAAVDACGLSLELGDVWFDVDTPADLLRLPRRLVRLD